MQRRLAAGAALLGVCWATVALVELGSVVAGWISRVEAVGGGVASVADINPNVQYKSPRGKRAISPPDYGPYWRM